MAELNCYNTGTFFSFVVTSVTESLPLRFILINKQYSLFGIFCEMYKTTVWPMYL